MDLAPLADVVAYLDPNPTRLARVERSLRSRFGTVWSAHDRCVMATRALPHSVADGDNLRTAGVAFAEGRDSLTAGARNGMALESLSGNVGFARAERDRIVVVRSGPGTVPWYVWQDEERAVVTTTFTEMVTLLPVAPRLDPLVCGMWAGFNATFPDNRTFVQGVVAVPPGHTADITPGRPVCPRSWWNPWPEEVIAWPSRGMRTHHAQVFGGAVLTVLEREVADKPVNLLTLSGGVDSSALAYLVSRQLGRPMGTLSFVPPLGAPESDYEASYLDPIIADLNIVPHVRQPLGPADHAVLVAGTPPVVFPVLHPALCVLPGLVQEHGFEILLGGEFADEICGGWPALPDWLDSVSFPRLVSRAPSLPRGRRDLVAWARRRRSGLSPGPWPASLPEWVQPDVNEEYQAWRSLMEKELWASTAPHRYQRALLTYLDGAVAMNWEVCSFLGVRRVFPFLNTEVLNVLSACHPVELLGPGPKRLEREAFAGMVPRRYLLRPDKRGWGAGDEAPAPAESYRLPTSLGSVLTERRGSVGPMQASSVRIMAHFADQLVRGSAHGANSG